MSKSEATLQLQLQHVYKTIDNFSIHNLDVEIAQGPRYHSHLQHGRGLRRHYGASPQSRTTGW